MSTRIQPPFMLYTLRVVKDTMGTPREPAVVIVQEELPNGRWLANHVLTPEQAATLAADLNAAADLPATHGSAFSTDTHTGPAQGCAACTAPTTPTITAEQAAAHAPAKAGWSSRIGEFVICRCQADRFGEGPQIAAADYPAHLLSALGIEVSL